jgi:hypothetical protein
VPVRRATKWLVVLAVIGLVAFIVIGSMARVHRSCQICLTFHGQTACRGGAGATNREAMSAARTVACGVMANGMDQVIECENTQPDSVECTNS